MIAVPRDYRHDTEYVHVTSGEYSYLWLVNRDLLVDFSQLTIDGNVSINTVDCCQRNDGFRYTLRIPVDLAVEVTLDSEVFIGWEDAVLHHRMLRGKWRCILREGVYQTDEEMEIHHLILDDDARILAPNTAVGSLTLRENTFASLRSAKKVYCRYSNTYVELAQEYRQYDSGLSDMVAPNKCFKTRAEYESAVGYNLIGHYSLPSRAKKPHVVS